MGVKGGRSAKKKLKIGICEDYRGDPDSVKFFRRTGLHYVSCSLLRIPVAGLALIQAVFEGEGLARGEIS